MITRRRACTLAKCKVYAAGFIAGTKVHDAGLAKPFRFLPSWPVSHCLARPAPTEETMHPAAPVVLSQYCLDLDDNRVLALWRVSRSSTSAYALHFFGQS